MFTITLICILREIVNYSVSHSSQRNIKLHTVLATSADFILSDFFELIKFEQNFFYFVTSVTSLK